MAVTPKHIRKESKEMAESVRKSPPISLTGAPKKEIKKRSEKIKKMNTRLEKRK